MNDTKYAMGLCIKNDCNRTSLTPLYMFLNQALAGALNCTNCTSPQIEFIIPSEDMDDERQGLFIVHWILVSLIILTTVLGVLGIIVEYTKLGNRKWSHEETNFANIDIPVINEGNGWE